MIFIRTELLRSIYRLLKVKPNKAKQTKTNQKKQNKTVLDLANNAFLSINQNMINRYTGYVPIVGFPSIRPMSGALVRAAR